MIYVIHKNAESLDGQVPGEGFERLRLSLRLSSAAAGIAALARNSFTSLQFESPQRRLQCRERDSSGFAFHYGSARPPLELLRLLAIPSLRSSSNPLKEDCNAGRGIRTLTGITSQRILSQNFHKNQRRFLHSPATIKPLSIKRFPVFCGCVFSFAGKRHC